MSCVMGVDPSLTGFAVCAYRFSTMTKGVYADEQWFERESKSESEGSDAPPRARMNRYAGLVERTVIAVRDMKPRVIVVEGYSFGSVGIGARSLAELRAHLLDRILPLVSAGVLILECPPATLKLFAIGVGKGDKAAVASALAARYKRSFATENLADAYGLCRIAMCIEGVCEAENEAQRRAVATTLGQKPEKAPKRKKKSEAA